MRTERRVDQRTARQAQHTDHARQRKAYSFGLTTRLGIVRLVLCGIRHRYPGPIDQLHHPAAPAPTVVCPFAQQPTRRAREGRHHLNRQALPRFAVRSRANTLCAQPFRQPLRCPAVHRLLARAILVQHLAHEHRQRHGRRIQPLSMLGQVLLRSPEQLRAGQQVEEIHRRGLSHPAANAPSTLLCSKLKTTIYQGWPRGRQGGCVVTNILPTPASLPTSLQCLALARAALPPK